MINDQICCWVLFFCIYCEVKQKRYVLLYHGLLYFFFEEACSLIVLDCTLRKFQPNIQGGGAKLQRTVRYISADIRLYCTAPYSTVLSTFDIYIYQFTLVFKRTRSFQVAETIYLHTVTERYHIPTVFRQTQIHLVPRLRN